MNFYGAFILGLMAIVLFSISSQGTDAFGQWTFGKERPRVKMCNETKDCDDSEFCNNKLCTYSCLDTDCKDAHTCNAKDHKAKCGCRPCFELNGNKCERAFLRCFTLSW